VRPNFQRRGYEVFDLNHIAVIRLDFRRAGCSVLGDHDGDNGGVHGLFGS
jgi:hypothetical protein